MPAFAVTRQGRQSAPIRFLYVGHDEAKARRVYERERKRMRQGTLDLVDGSGALASTWEPMCRTRW